MRRLLIVAYVTVVFTALGLRAAELQSDTDRGMKPGLAYRVSGLDHVNLFNGVMNLTVPIGQTYTVGGKLAYSFQLSYATNTWDVGHNETDYGVPYDPNDPDTTEYRFPSKHTNAGLGWMFTLGKLYFPPYGSGREGVYYVGPDGAEHRFYGLDTAVTRDGTYLRLTETGNANFPHRVEFPSGEFHTFYPDGRLRSMADRFGNEVTIDYGQETSPYQPNEQRSVWTITDSTQRQHKVYFRKGWSYYEYFWEQYTPGSLVPHEVLDRIELAAFGSDGAKAEYKFHYDASYRDLVQGAPLDNSLTTSRPCPPKHDYHTAPYVYIPVLKTIEMPEGVQYEFVTDRGDHETCKSFMAGSISGNITSMTLPTSGTIEWQYQPYVFPVMSVTGSLKPYSGLSIRQSVNAGLKKRVEKIGATVVGTTDYTGGIVDPASSWSDMFRVVKNYDGENALLNATVHYFSGCRSKLQCESGGIMRYAGEYGRPFTRQKPKSGEGFLSTEFQTPDDEGNLLTRRSTYLRHESDSGQPALVEGSEANLRVAYQKTVYEDGHYTDVRYSRHDGRGHYRKSETGGDLTGNNVRTTFTDYNPQTGSYEFNPDGTILTAATSPTATEPWILDTYDRQWTAELVQKSDGSTAMQVSEAAFCFDSLGFLTNRRIYKNFGTVPDTAPAADTEDLVTFFERSQGNVVAERYYKGVASSCGASAPSGAAYVLRHEYDHGVLARSWHETQTGTAMSFYLIDRTIDRNTGLPSASRLFRTHAGSDGKTTTYDFDKLGRIKTIDDGALLTSHVYAMSPPKITSTDKWNGTILRTTSVEFDALGRVNLETRSLAPVPPAPVPGIEPPVTAEKRTTYNSLGWVTSSTDWGASAPTLFGYDGFGRTTLIQPPDVLSPAQAAKIQYTGISKINRMSTIQTSAGLVEATTTEEYDGLGRLIKVTEPPPDTGASGPVTKYVYDVGSRLIEVCANFTSACGQKRTFTYDNRGFLSSEDHPESGPITYSGYDARGHLGRRYRADGQFDVSFVYDRAERLREVNENAGGTMRPLKRFEFFGDNATWPMANGQLKQAIRYNWLDNGYTVQVEELYEYANQAKNTQGRPTARVTRDWACLTSPQCNAPLAGSKLHEFRQSFTHDPLGNVETLGYPCLLVQGTCGSPRTVTNEYESGFLKSVATSGVSSTLGYHQSGMVASVVHGNGVTDTIEVDSKTPSRPSKIVTGGIHVPTSCVAPAFTKQPSSKTATAGATVLLEASASGETGAQMTYTWYRGVAPDRSQPVASGSSGSYTATVSTTTSFWVEASNGCPPAAVSQTATVTMCTAAHVNVTDAKTITRGQMTKLYASVSGTTPIQYQWFVVNGTSEMPIGGATSSSITVEPSVTTRYRARVSNSCGSDFEDVVISVVAEPSAPSGVNAIYAASVGGVQIWWSASTSGAPLKHYLLDRFPAWPGATPVVLAPSTSYLDGTVQAGVAYRYTVRAVDNNLVQSTPSAPDFATVKTFADDPLLTPPAGLTFIRAVHLVELREAVAALRVLAGLAPPVWARASLAGVLVDDGDFTEIQIRMNEARTALGFGTIILSEPPAQDQAVKGSTIRELREGVR